MDSEKYIKEMKDMDYKNQKALRILQNKQENDIDYLRRQAETYYQEIIRHGATVVKLHQENTELKTEIQRLDEENAARKDAYLKVVNMLHELQESVNRLRVSEGGQWQPKTKRGKKNY